MAFDRAAVLAEVAGLAGFAVHSIHRTHPPSAAPPRVGGHDERAARIDVAGDAALRAGRFVPFTRRPKLADARWRQSASTSPERPAVSIS
jgi:hypothetical protein